MMPSAEVTQQNSDLMVIESLNKAAGACNDIKQFALIDQLR
jgi:hypothetical protein